MTRYAFDEDSRKLIASWATGGGDVATTVTGLPVSCGADSALRLAWGLTRLSEVAWRCYTHPASAENSVEPNSEGWRRKGQREAFSQVIAAITKPNLPAEGVVVREYNPVIESSHAVGRALHEVADAEVSSRIVRDVQYELDAIEQAERGDLSGRARQAVVLTREDASPLQVVAADELFHEDPRGHPRTFTSFEPTAASVAAAHWLHAAATVAAEHADIAVTRVIYETDNIEALPTESPTRVLELIERGMSPREVVTRLIREAMHVADGVILRPKAITRAIRKAAALKRRYGASDDIRATPLDPMRPAPNLLEDLVSGLYGCWLLYRDSVHASIPSASDIEGEDDADDDDGSAAADEEILAQFKEEVRAEALARRSRLI